MTDFPVLQVHLASFESLFPPPVLAIFTGASSIIRRNNLCRHYVDANEDSLQKPPSLFTTLYTFLLSKEWIVAPIERRRTRFQRINLACIGDIQEPLEYLPASTLIRRPVA